MAQADNVGPVMLKSGEYVVRKEAVDKLGKDTMDMINNADRLGYMGGGLVPKGGHGHSAIDELLALNTLSTQKNTDMTRQSAMMQRGGQIKPIMSKEKSTYSIGVVDDLAKSLGYFDDMSEFVIPFNKRSRGLLDDLEQAGQLDTQKALEALDLIAKRYYEGTADKMSKPKKYQDGGMISYGSQTTSAPTLEELYAQAGITPVGEQRRQFESQFTYDPSREETTVAGYMQGLEGTRASGTGALGRAMSGAQQAGGGFAGFGARAGATQMAREAAQRGYESAQESAQRGMFEDIRAQRERYTQEALGQLGQLESVGGTQAFTAPPPEVSSLPSSDQGAVTYNGVSYVWDSESGQYITEDQYEQGMSEYYDSTYG